MKKIILLLIVSGILVGSYYFIFSKENWEESIGLPIPISNEQKYAETLSEKDIEKFLFYNLPDKVMAVQFGGKVFCSNKIYGSRRDYKKKILEVYAYTYCEEYYLRDTVVTLGGGIATPLKATFTIGEDGLTYQSVDFPNNGSEYEKSLSKLFPENLINEVKVKVDTTKLTPLPKTQAENYYKGKLEVYF